ncbi:TPA: hypothetical protein I7730_00680 [Vibrio vulnificus]|uniref:Uncharacterized protein n=1 Tax=Vibrio vulnificus TaxID=672 RepID=A0A8H9K739_VIBVL|nr:hypothetical protein [Vibrio vulnificus]HAS8538314.1 hypothetical protein [Vibrio vulnificus]
MKTIPFHQLETDFFKVNKAQNTVRFGQYFIIKCVSDESDELLEGLWQKSDFKEAREHCLMFIDQKGWDLNALEVVNNIDGL